MPGRHRWRSVWSLEERASFEWYNNRSLHAMFGTLYVVATPIGNLEDITLRALRVLREVALIAAEDTRRTARLLTHHGISTPTISFHEHNAHTRTPQLITKLVSGSSVALVTDAGTPGVSDPGVEMVSACIEAGIPIDPVPGVSAPLTAAVASGFHLDSLTILGFVPSRSKDRKSFLENVARQSGTVTFFEAPHRITETLREMDRVLGTRQIVLARELTKIHQEFRRGSASELLADPITTKGEFTLVVAPAVQAQNTPEFPSDSQIAAEFGETAKLSELGRRAALSSLAKKYGRSTREVYAAVERAKMLVTTPKTDV
jgi:16S rRNA (cytidine1402-2'-O)-methyltransferase